MNHSRQALFDTLAQVGKAMGNGHRLTLLERLSQGEAPVETLSSCADLTVGNTSQHLQHLRRAGLVTARRDGRQIFYRLTDERIMQLMCLMRGIAETNLAEMERLLGKLFPESDGAGELEAISRDALRGKLERGEVTVLDVRPQDEFHSGHLRGAINIPVEKLEQMLDQLPKNREVVAYCRGPYCFLSREAVRILRSHGFQVRRLEDGYPSWKAAGLPVDRVGT
ncbi:MAG: ArsR family transcriptional regulator [Alteromonadaceae bacterium]|nr:ArsR family transcriptional regulator [Alteromonadaceae bacterium]|tara:strand:+ start:286 stop:957 length:672 start_codon:yes stop_codon:yes gene_type:complete